mmetsp:Transcript_24312/g.33370  ORF Transcript_24312/g.33370 Transcript_24312/m.33370 type:complete len:709 (-) Transcript_24312:136-2262(-)|eukprot:CAMPEP_0201478056 /NCGR_PEP_ID=MMETSP0151_2-20130828/2974_1 /ASSEMBLY_ACC=CAM_ASM_000257 /TAXON_ID=200890 /ORGANISM="Paramoeba atlantica, Strain 621/1 / CCAP 1560/9" /LENGTH=708 /DNA_ID=CAMNT_0047858995 /DNA_START=88 /DNA_END=2214 /DNA_ORIENTATION=-
MSLRKPLEDVSNSRESRLAKPTTERKRERTGTQLTSTAPSQKTRKMDPSSTSSSSSRSSTRPATLTTSSRTSTTGRSTSSRPSTTSSSSSRTSTRPSTTSSSSSRTTAARSSTTTSSSTTSSSSSKSAAAALAGSRPHKRAAWDTKGRLQDLEELQHSMKSKIKENDSRVVYLEKLLNEKDSAVNVLVSDKEDLKGNLQEYRQQIQEETQAKQRFMLELEQAKVRHQADLQEKTMKIGSLQSEIQGLKVQVQVLESESDRLRTQNTTQSMEIDHLKKDFALKETRFEAEIAKLKQMIVERDEENEQKGQKIDECENIMAEQSEKIEELEARQRADENLRRKLHNAIQELKGNIRVFCRVRPLSQKEEERDDVSPVLFQKHDPRNLEIVTTGLTSNSGRALPDKRQPFSFDKVFNPESTQEDVFLEISQLVQSSLDGYNTCIFAYGQTGSGKTYTMEGGHSPQKEGMIPRTVRQIFETSKGLEALGWDYHFECQFLEIYNENLRDLLALNQREEKDNSCKHEIKHSRDGQTHVTDMTVVKVERPEQVHQLLKRAAKNRATEKTEKNDRSSRSHSVFQIKIEGRNTISGKTACGVLSLIDLAGSERLSTSGAEGQRKKETQYINKSLSSLGDVICALANKDGHIPFRNSKLTYLLQNSLGGNSKTLMFVNVSPAQSDVSESVSSLRFATKVNSCEIGVARRGGKIDLKDI